MKLMKRSEKPARRDVFADFFDEFFDTDADSAISAKLNPAVDIVEEKDKYVVKADLPGLKQEEIKVELDDSILTISGERKEAKEEKDRDKKYHYIGRSYGVFERRFTLPKNTDPEKIKAQYKNGELKLEIPKTEETKPRQITVE